MVQNWHERFIPAQNNLARNPATINQDFRNISRAAPEGLINLFNVFRFSPIQYASSVDYSAG